MNSPVVVNSFHTYRNLALACCMALVLCLSIQTQRTSADGIKPDAATISFNQQVNPILADKCLACHGADDAKREADLRLDDRDAAINFGAIKPGEPANSSMIERIMSEDPELVMPPPSSHKSLSDEEKSILTKWIAEGANFEKHWSFEKPRMPSMPSVANREWVRNPIDSFVLSKLESAGLEPAPEADLRTLIRRVCLDLTGLPPTPEEIEDVIANPNPDRYERYVDQLLNRETWGEHRARYWLDYARYADTHGIHFDNYREMYSYRDWVIQAFNNNMPFDQFTIEQLAGDLLPNASLDQHIATGFHRCNITTNEGGIIDEEYVVLYARDRVETTGAVWLGLTVGCAVCHNHKFDPITQKEFYELSAFFNNTTQGPRDGNRKDTPPVVNVPLPEDREHYKMLQSEFDSLTQQIKQQEQQAKTAFDAWLKSGNATESISEKSESSNHNSLTFHAPLNERAGKQIAYTTGKSDIRAEFLPRELATTNGAIADHAWLIQNDVRPTWKHAGDFEADQQFSVALWIKPKADTNASAVIARMDPAANHRGWDVWLESGSVAMHLISRWPEDAAKVVSEQKLKTDAWNHVVFTYDGSKKAAGFQCFINGQISRLNVASDSLQSSTRTQVPLRLGGRDTGAVAANVGVQDVRIYSGKLVDSDVRSLANDYRALFLASKITGGISDEEQNEIFVYYLNNLDEQYAKLKVQSDAVAAEMKTIEARGTVAHVMAERETKPIAFLLQRGDYDKRLEEVSPNTPKVLPPLKDDYPKNRLGLAMWLVSEENPLTARVTANRCWQEIFGRGIVSTAGDFGITGTMPTNQPLLDYLAIDLQQNGWDLKELYRQMVLSSTYRQASVVTAEKLAKDTDNSLLSRGPRYRMDAEMVRDYALAASGLLNPVIGGRSVRPYQPPGVWEAVAMPESDTKSYRLDEPSMLYRRSMYTFWKRAAPPASMDVLNAPAREVCTVKRERTNTPLQALVTMNDPQFVEAARVMAQNVLSSDKWNDDSARIQRMVALVLGRQFSGDELAVATETLNAAREYYSANQEDALKFVKTGNSPVNETLNSVELAAWTLVANQVLNLDEALCK